MKLTRKWHCSQNIVEKCHCFITGINLQIRVFEIEYLAFPA